MVRKNIGWFLILIIFSLSLATLTACNKCDICGTYYSTKFVDMGVNYITINSDGTCEGAIFVGTWEYHERVIDPELPLWKTVTIRSPVIGAVTYRVRENTLISPTGEVFTRPK